ncbi:hypothetical protein BC828DRAFT_372062 [Blastocladiella britannica]|nr:hypothetical protein BC828DRAFT_372062 [Blastocladiella britannica]
MMPAVVIPPPPFFGSPPKSSPLAMSNRTSSSSAAAHEPLPASPASGNNDATATDGKCPHDTFLDPHTPGNPFCGQCAQPVARLYAMHVSLLDARDRMADAESALAVQATALARARTEVERLRNTVEELEDRCDEATDRADAAERARDEGNAAMDRVRELEAMLADTQRDRDAARAAMDREREAAREASMRADDLAAEVQRTQDRAAAAEAEAATAHAAMLEARATASDLARQKHAIEAELEDLSRQLFENANSMVATESRARHEESARLAVAERDLAMERMQLRELKGMLSAVDVDRDRDARRIRELEVAVTELEEDLRAAQTVVVHSPRNVRSSVASASTIASRISLSAPPTSSGGDGVQLDAIDPAILDAFLDYMSSAPATPLPKCAQLPFLHGALTYDLGACLSFSATGAPTTAALVEAMLLAAVEITPYDPAEAAKRAAARDRAGSTDSAIVHEQQQQQQQQQQTARGFFGGLWGSKSAAAAAASVNTSSTLGAAPVSTASATEASVPTKCTLCGEQASPLPFAVLVSPDDPVAAREYPCCRFCRDRVVAACDFMSFARNLRAGLFTRQNLTKVWADSLQLRSRLGYARLGSLAVVDGVSSSPTAAV